MQVEGTPTRAGSIALNASYPKADAPLVSALKTSGAIVLAKANMDTFAIGGASACEVAGVTKNPLVLTSHRQPDPVVGTGLAERRCSE